MARIHQITPFFTIENLDAAVDFFHTGLGFKLLVRYDDYAYLQRDSAGVRLLRGKAASGRVHAYLDVEDVDSLWAEVHTRIPLALNNNPDGPRNQTYGQREFTVFGPEGITLFFGGEIFRDDPGWQRAARESNPPTH